jgi:hypothetical protein
MHPYLTRQLIDDYQAQLRGEVGGRAPWNRSLRDAPSSAVVATRRARRATGWALVEIGLKLAVSVSPETTQR